MMQPPWSQRIPIRPRPETTLAELEERFPRWTIWISGVGRWWATDRGDITLAQRAAGCESTIEADSADDLWDELVRQERLRGRS